MDLDDLRRGLEECLEKKIPVLGVTAVFGTTQEGAVDDLREILDIRHEFINRGLTFYIHVDGAWGGYFASCIYDQDQRRISRPTIRPRSVPAKTAGPGGINLRRNASFLTKQQSVVYLDSSLSSHFTAQLECLKDANSITLDPHKSGFCPYPAGGLLYRNGNIRNFLAQGAAYISHGQGKNEEINLFGIDGSKPGAASAGVWLSHKVTGLNADGYGLLLRQSSFSAGIVSYKDNLSSKSSQLKYFLDVRYVGQSWS